MSISAVHYGTFVSSVALPPRFSARATLCFFTGLFLLVIATIGAAARADEARGIRAASSQAIVAPGGVLLLPLTADRPGTDWPETLAVTLDDGQAIIGHIGWMTSRQPGPGQPRAWTDPPHTLSVRTIQPSDDSSAGGVAILLAALPPSVTHGDATVLDQRITLSWGDPNRGYSAFPLPDPAQPRLPAIAADDRPDPTDPFVHWRWVLLADRLDRLPPALDRFTPLEQLAARAHADMWRIGLARLADSSSSVAADCRDLLTDTAYDGDHAFAAWVTDASALARILFEDRMPRRLDAAQAWLREQRTLLVWTGERADGTLELRIINRAIRPLVARWRWLDDLDPTALALALPGRTLTRTPVDRPVPIVSEDPLSPLARFETRSSWQLELICETDRRLIEAGPPVVPARPPGVILPAFRTSLTLSDVSQGQSPAVPLERATALQLRRRAGQWEAFFECRRPAASAGAGESVTLLIGPADDPTFVVEIPETGPAVMLTDNWSTPVKVYRRSWQDRWYARIIVPTAWLLPHNDSAATAFAAFRRHSDADAIETTPAASVPWMIHAGRIGADLSYWDAAASRKR